MMDTIKKQPLIVAGAALVVGVLLGWLVIGWGLWPVEYVDGNVYQLRGALQDDYVRLTASNYAFDGDLQRAADRIAQLGPNVTTAFDSALANSQANPNDVNDITQLKTALETNGKMPAATAPSGGGGMLIPLLCSLVVVLALIGGGLFGARQLGLMGKKGPPTTTSIALKMSADAVKTDYSSAAAVTPTGAPPVAQFMTTYVLGDDLYDDSFSIEDQSGGFLGECGMGISETIGVGDPKKVTAFEVWVFDKNDIRTVTKVLMSEHAFRDEALKSRLAAKGEPVMVKPGDVVAMDTATLTVTARVVDMAYGGGALPPSSFFERLTIELAAFPKAAA